MISQGIPLSYFEKSMFIYLQTHISLLPEKKKSLFMVISSEDSGIVGM